MKILYWKKPVKEDFAVESPANLDEIESFVVAELVRNRIKFDGDYHQYGVCIYNNLAPLGTFNSKCLESNVFAPPGVRA